MMAAARARRGLAFFTFMDETLKEELEQIHQLLVIEGVTVGKRFCTLLVRFISPELLAKYVNVEIMFCFGVFLQGNCLNF